ncbi:putative regulator of septum formation [Krasilnikovia cinnamomea]|uniref:Putative regulator of septum formation n=2 Tax=Krasilnikovia cinnamomea TaxID=349313 RepID=A0A4V6MG30_9ACTN|nr:putative regulator of septum formation [Krasilnikovia cinnamomea]
MAPAGPYPGYPPPPPAGTNGFAIASLVFGVIGGVLFSTIFGIIALSQIRRRGQSGRGLAIGGLVASGCWVLVIGALVTIGIVFGDTGGRRSADADGGTGPVSVTRLHTGDCVGKVPGDNGTTIEDVPVVPCALPHEGEVFAVFDLPAGPWPGQRQVETQAEKRCQDELDKYLKTPDDKLESYSLLPLRESWEDDRGVTCVVTGPTQLTGSLRK